MGQPLPYKGGYYLWHYVPSLPGAIILLVAFIIITGLHTWRMFRTRSWFCIPFWIGSIFEIVGYIGRAAAHSATDQLGPYIIQSVLLLVAPALFAASIYMVLGRVIVALPGGPQCSLIRPSWLTKVFVAGDVASFFVQAGGAGIMTSGDNQSTGQSVIVGGLFVQIVMFGLFVVTAVLFHVRYGRRGAQRAESGAEEEARYGLDEDVVVPWRRILTVLYGVSALIMARSIFRVVEYLMGADGYPLTHEWTLYVFDGVLMLGTMVIFFVWFPSNIRPAGVISVAPTVEMTSPEAQKGEYSASSS
ncbi:RTA1 like protein [Pleurostoma richardsiae]|uniref:RTA1 like protein n=1 Tax=Pleurostoma richardsiae TaxID=41990 RepID=A0AA38VU10_9PEZI|nr:RTA1 like protein [Pleurostoma richardsiae]